MQKLKKDGTPRKPRPKATEETKRRMSETRKDRELTPEHRAAISQAHIRRSQLFMGVRELLEEVPIRSLPEGLRVRAEVIVAYYQAKK